MSAWSPRSSAAPGATLRLLTLATLLGIGGVRSLALTAAQTAAEPLPAVGPFALAAAACALLSVALPATAPRVTDDETDVIAGVAPLLLGGWLIATGSGRLGDHFWLWRPDLVGLWLSAVGIACVLLGARAAGFLAAPLAAATIAATPIAQLLLAGLAPGPVREAVVAAALTGLPFVVTRAPARAVRPRPVVVAGAAALAAAGVAAALHPASGVAGLVGASAGLAAGAAGAVRRRPNTRRGLPLGNLGRSRVALLALASAGVALVDVTDVPRLPAIASASAAVVDPPPRAVSVELGRGLAVTSWQFDPGGPDDQLGMVVLTSARSIAAAVTVPLDSLVRWPVDVCPTARTLRLDGLTVVMHLYADVERGFRWSTLEWLARRPGGAPERVDVILGQGPSGEPSELPPLAPDAALDAARTMGRFVAARRLDCQRDIPQGTDVLPAMLERVLRGAA